MQHSELTASHPNCRETAFTATDAELLDLLQRIIDALMGTRTEELASIGAEVSPQ